MRGRAAADRSKVRRGSGNQESGSANSTNDALEQASSPPQGPAAPWRLCSLGPALPRSQQRPCKAAAPGISIPHHTASARQHPSGASIRRAAAPTQTHRPPASSEGRHGGAHLPQIKPEALSPFDTLQARCMSKQICLRSVRLPVCLRPGVKEPRTRDKGTVGEATDGDGTCQAPPALPQERPSCSRAPMAGLGRERKG